MHKHSKQAPTPISFPRRITLVAIGVVLQTTLVFQTPALAVDAETVVGGKCTACHSIDKIREAKKTKTEWKLLVDKEIERGAGLDEPERVAVVGWLAQNYGPLAATPAAVPPVADVQAENTTTALPFDEQAYTGVELWHFLVSGSLLLAAGAWLRRGGQKTGRWLV